MWYRLIINGEPRSDAGAALLANPPMVGQGCFIRKQFRAAGRDIDVCNRKIDEEQPIVYTVDGKIQLSANDLVNHLACGT